MKARTVLDDAVKVLKASPAIDHWQRGRERIEAEDLLWHVLGEEPDPRDEVSVEQRRAFDRLVRRRATGEPIPFIKGYTEFRGIDLHVRPGVFVPRDASEFLAEQAIRRLRGRARPVHLDLATGAGTIALAVANEVRKASVVGTDLSADAIEARAREREAARSARSLLHRRPVRRAPADAARARWTSSRCTRRTCRCTSSRTCPRRSASGSRSTR